jgi:N-hydroxyarylamine O-acetyltransferase
VAALSEYLARIGYRGGLDPTAETLRALHRAHLLAIPYENLDIHLGRPLVLDSERVFAKLVTGRRGGWCYEMNGLFAWALGRIGFSVRLLAGAVGRDRAGTGVGAEGNHLVLLVELERQYLADVGFGDGLLEPIPLAPGEYHQGFLRFGLERSGARWVFHNHPHGGAASFDFTLAPHRLSDFAAKCRELQTSPASGFVQKTVCQRIFPDRIVTLRGAVLRIVSAAGVSQRVVADAGEYDAILREQFDLAIPESRDLWPRVWSRHLDWQASQV